MYSDTVSMESHADEAHFAELALQVPDQYFERMFGNWRLAYEASNCMREALASRKHVLKHTVTLSHNGFSSGKELWDALYSISCTRNIVCLNFIEVKLPLHLLDVQLAHRVFENCPLLENIQLKRNELRGKRLMKMVFAMLSGCSSLTQLTIVENQLRYDGSVAMAESLQHWPLLSKLCLCENEISVKGMEALSKKLQNHSSLQEFDVSYNPILSQSLEKLNQALSTCSKLRRVEMQSMWNPRFIAVMPYMIMVPKSDTLVAFKFSRNAFAFVSRHSEVLESFKNCLVSCVNLEDLDVSKNFLGHERFKALCEVFPKLTRLATLNLADMDLKPVSLETLSNVVPKCLNLTMLDVSGNHMIKHMSSEGTMDAIRFKTFLGCLHHCRWLSILKFCQFGFCPISLRLLFENLHRCQALTSLHLKSNKIARIGMDIVTANLPFVTSLKCLDLSGNILEDNHATALLDVIESHACLEDIRLRLNFISEEGRTNIETRVHSFARPCSVDLEGCDFAYINFHLKQNDHWMDTFVRMVEEMD